MLEVTGVSINGLRIVYSFSDGSTAVLESEKKFTGRWGLSSKSSVTEEQWQAIQNLVNRQKGNVL